jgi:hypothetical protein
MWPPGEYVGRPCRWSPGSVLANPYHLGPHVPRPEVIGKYERWFWQQWRESGPVRAELERLAAQYQREGQLTLLCWCAPLPCHAEVIRDAVLRLCGEGAGPHDP